VQKYAVEGNKVLLLTPRGWIKSYVVTVGWTIQRMLRNLVSGNREHEIISNATIKNAKNFLEKIKYNFKFNELLRGLFREYLHSDMENMAEKWTQDEVQLNGNLIETGSVEGNLVSQHYKVMINDDLVNRDNSLTKDQLLKTVDWWRLSQSLLQSNGIEIDIGTRWSPDDLYGEFINQFIQPEKNYSLGKAIVELHRGNYHLLQMDCWENPEKETGSTFPVLFPEEKLKELQRLLGSKFNGQYRNDPLSRGRNPFSADWISRWVPGDLPAIRYTVMLIDPSGKAQVDSDYTGVTIIHLCADKKGYIELGKRYMITDKALAEWIITNACFHRPDTIAIEDNKFNVIYELLELLIGDWLRCGRIEKNDQDYARTIPYILQEVASHGRPKESRIRNLTGWIENGSFKFPYTGAEDLEDEMIKYPSVKDDCLDSFAYVMDVLLFPKPTDSPKVRIAKVRDEQREEEEWKNLREESMTGMRESFPDYDLY
jgi:hypothetical protein